MIIGIDHVSIASAELAETLRFFEGFGLKLVYQEDLPSEGVRSNQMDAGNANIEILEAIRPDAPLVKFLETRGPGLHHVCFRVDDLDATLALMLERGYQLATPQPREDGQGRRVFIHPKSGGGVLMGFVERHPEQVSSIHRRVIDPGWKSYQRFTFPPAVAARGEMVFVSGLNAVDDDGVLQCPDDIVGQCRVIYEKLAALMAAAGGTMANVVRTTDYVLTRDGYRGTADVRREFFGDQFSAATGVIVKELLGRGVLIEIDAIGVLPASSAS
jgi:methylmalonyl-CoA epimerase